MKCNLINKNIVSNYLEELLRERGVTDLDGFLNPTDDLIQSPYDLDNVAEGWQLIESEKNSKILIVQDCDVDGLTSAAIMYLFLKEKILDVDISIFIHEHKQHGLSDVIRDDKIANGTYGLIIVPDAGTNDYEYIEQLREVNTKVLIIDHHLKNEETPISTNCVLINNQTSANYNNKELTGAGVVWQFLRTVDKDAAERYTDLAALGIISDMGSALSLENRAIIKKGLQNINNYFLQKACEKQSYSMGGKINYTTVAFYITPMLNSMIRVGSKPEKTRLFTAVVDGHEKVPCNKRGAKGTFEEVAIESLRECTNTKTKQDKITAAAVEQLSVKIFNNNLLDNKILFVELEDEDDFPQEVNGLTCMKLSAANKKPTLIGRRGPDGKIKGSIRGLSNSPLASLREFLLGSGMFEYVSGHDNAAGFSLPIKKIEEFIQYANEELKDMVFSENYYDVNFVRFAAERDLAELIYTIGDASDVWGQNCKEPLVYVKDINLSKDEIQIIGSRGDTIKFEKFGVTYIKFFAKEMIEDLKNYNSIKMEVVGKANLNEWNGRVTPQIFIENYEIKDDTYGF